MNRTRRRGFTLIELLVVIAIIAVLIALLLAGRAGGAGGGAADPVHRTTSSRSAWRCTTTRRPSGRLPMSMACPGRGNTVAYDTGWSAQARILPYLEGNALFNAANLCGLQGRPGQLHGHRPERRRPSSARARSSRSPPARLRPTPA